MNQIKDIVLEGHLIEEVSLYGELNPTVTLVGEMSLPVDYDSYDNSYIVTPSVDSQILYTDDKKMTDNVIINPIPYAEVSNLQGGRTIIIGG